MDYEARAVSVHEARFAGRTERGTVASYIEIRANLTGFANSAIVNLRGGAAW